MVWKENRENAYCEITPAILALKEQWEKKNHIDPKLYKEYNVKRGLRDEDGRGVLTGLTRVGEIQSYSVTEGEPWTFRSASSGSMSRMELCVKSPFGLPKCSRKRTRCFQADGPSRRRRTAAVLNADHS